MGYNSGTAGVFLFVHWVPSRDDLEILAPRFAPRTLAQGRPWPRVSLQFALAALTALRSPIGCPKAPRRAIARIKIGTSNGRNRHISVCPAAATCRDVNRMTPSLTSSCLRSKADPFRHTHLCEARKRRDRPYNVFGSICRGAFG